MYTNVFISWSGNLSEQFAKTLRDWLPSVLQHVRPYFSPDDIEKGTKWDKEISKELEKTQVGIICLTRENLERPWVVFEAGALSKNVEQSNVCPIVLDLRKADIQGPLSRFQATELNKKDFKRLITTINRTSGDHALETKVLDNVFEKWWPDFEAKTKQILSDTPNTPEPDEPFRDDRGLLEEILQLIRIKNMDSINHFRHNEQAAEAVRQIVIALHDIWALFDGIHDDAIRPDYKRMETPIRILTGMFGRDDLYIYFKQMISKMTLNEAQEIIKKAGPAKLPDGASLEPPTKDTSSQGSKRI